MSAANTLRHAAALLDRWGFTPGDPTGSPLTGFSLAGAIDQAAADLIGELGHAAPNRFAYLGKRVKARHAAVYAAEVLGCDAGGLSPAEIRRRLTLDKSDAQLATPWAVAVCRQAADLAATSSTTGRPLAAALTVPTQRTRAVQVA